MTSDEHFVSEGEDAMCDVAKATATELGTAGRRSGPSTASRNVQKPASPLIRPSFFSCKLLVSEGFSFSPLLRVDLLDALVAELQ